MVSMVFISLDGDVTDVRVEVDEEDRSRPGLDRAVERRVHHRAAINVEAVADPHRREDAGDGRRSHDHLATELLADVVVFKYLQLARLPVRRYDPQFPRRVTDGLQPDRPLEHLAERLDGDERAEVNELQRALHPPAGRQEVKSSREETAREEGGVAAEVGDRPERVSEAVGVE